MCIYESNGEKVREKRKLVVFEWTKMGLVMEENFAVSSGCSASYFI